MEFLHDSDDGGENDTRGRCPAVVINECATSANKQPRFASATTFCGALNEVRSYSEGDTERRAATKVGTRARRTVWLV